MEYVYDITIAYPDKIVQTENDFALMGECPRRVDFSVKRYHLDRDILNANDVGQLAEWCKNIWATKETVLEEFYRSDNSEERKFNTTPIENENENQRLFVLLVALVFWIAFVFVWIYCVCFCFYVTVYVSFGAGVFWFVEHFYGGVEKLSIRITSTG